MKIRIKMNKSFKRWAILLLTALAIFLATDLCARERGVRCPREAEPANTSLRPGPGESGCRKPFPRNSCFNAGATATLRGPVARPEGIFADPERNSAREGVNFAGRTSRA